MGETMGVYATPAMAGDVEMLCRDLLQEQLDAGQDSVGTRLNIEHLAATPEGLWVELTARISDVDRRAVTFETVVRDAFDQVARCTHTRFVIEMERLKERLAAKIARAKAQ